MDKKTRIIVFSAIGVIGVIALVWAWYEPAPKVDPTIVETAAESARASAAQQPPVSDPPVIIKGRARPGSLGGPSH